MLKVFGLFILAAIFEIIGCISMFSWMRDRDDWILGVMSITTLLIFAGLLSLFPELPSRTYAMYGGVYITTAFLWLVFVDKEMPTTKDIFGVIFVLIGAFIISSQITFEK